MRHEYFEKVFVWLIVLNTGLMATDYHSLGAKHMGETHKEVLAIANIAFVTAFGLEVGLKLLGLGFDEFARDRFNLFDALVTLGSIVELVLEPVLAALSEGDEEGSGVQLSALRTFRMLRVMKLARNWASLRKLLEAVISSIEQVGYLFFLLCLFAFIFAARQKLCVSFNTLPPAEPLVKSFPPDVAALFFMLVNDIVTDTCVEHRVIDWRKNFQESPHKAQTAANDPRVSRRGAAVNWN